MITLAALFDIQNDVPSRDSFSFEPMLLPNAEPPPKAANGAMAQATAPA